jgi:hypothetical protein
MAFGVAPDPVGQLPAPHALGFGDRAALIRDDFLQVFDEAGRVFFARRRVYDEDHFVNSFLSQNSSSLWMSSLGLVAEARRKESANSFQ